jgi:hypothetical protein
MQAEDLEKLRRFNEEWDQQNSTDTSKIIDPGMPNKGDGNQTLGLADQIAANSMNLQPGTYSPASIPTTGDSCTQCGTMHPPVKPGDVCPVAIELGKVDKDGNPIVAQPAQPAQPTPQPEIIKETDHGDFTPPEGPSEAQPITPKVQPQEVKSAPIVRDTNKPVDPEPTPLVEKNNIPTEIHVNKYLNSWSDLIMTHCKTHNIVNVKRLMRHLTVEVTDFLEHNKGR